MELFDRIDVVVRGRELTARPIQFEYDADRNPIRATHYETTCPDCGDMIQFMPEQLVNIAGVKHIGCFVCGFGIDLGNDEGKIVVAKSGQIIAERDKEVDRGCPFIDPIVTGIFDVTRV